MNNFKDCKSNTGTKGKYHIFTIQKNGEKIKLYGYTKLSTTYEKTNDLPFNPNYLFDIIESGCQ